LDDIKKNGSLHMGCLALLDNKCVKSFINTQAADADVLLDSLLIESKNGDSMEKA
jgi:hypothetical protein